MRFFIVFMTCFLMLSCTPVIFKYKPELTNLSKEDDFYFLELNDGKIGFNPKLWVQPKAGFQCKLKFGGFDLSKIKKIIVQNNQSEIIIEIEQDSLFKMQDDGVVEIIQVEKGGLIKKKELKKMDRVTINLFQKDSIITIPFVVDE